MNSKKKTKKNKKKSNPLHNTKTNILVQSLNDVSELRGT